MLSREERRAILAIGLTLLLSTTLVVWSDVRTTPQWTGVSSRVSASDARSSTGVALSARTSPQVGHGSLGDVTDPARVGAQAKSQARPVKDGGAMGKTSRTESERGSSAAESSPRVRSGLVNINTATQAELDLLPGIGPALAQRVVDLRKTKGRFSAVDDLLQVSGIGPAKLAKLRSQATVGDTGGVAMAGE